MATNAAILAILSAGCLIAEQDPAKADFERDIQPLLREHCVECHGPSQQMRGLRLDRRRDALPNRVGANGSRIVPGDSARSVLFQRLTGTQAGPQMPPTGPLPEQKIKLIQSWIDQGAVWPDELSGDRALPHLHRRKCVPRCAKRGWRIPTSRQGQSKVNQCQRPGWLDAPDVRGALR